MPSTHHNPELEQPYPLARIFYARLLPALILLLVALVVLVGFVVRQSTERIYLERAARTAENIARDVAGRLPEAWSRMLKGEPLSESEATALARTFAEEQSEYRLVGLKVYDLKGRALYSHDSQDIGKFENGRALKKVISGGESSVTHHLESDGSAVYELYVPLTVDERLAAVFELYETTNGEFQSTISGTIIPVVSTLLALLAMLVLLFVPVVKRAQTAITDRTLAVVGMRRRLERLLSNSAVETMSHADPEMRQASNRIEMTLLYSDIRGFTPFCEGREPEQTIEVLNQIIGIQVDEIGRQGGDVDKIIGDAVLARFEGEGREKRAVAAAIAIQANLASSDLPLEVGIGLFSGPVVAGLLGSGERLDYTVIGDSVNIAARLCGTAKSREIVGDVATVECSGAAGFGQVKELHIKGRTQAIAARVWNPTVLSDVKDRPIDRQ